jgi:cysteine synthase A
MSKIYTAADQLIGHTPLLELTHIEKEQNLSATSSQSWSTSTRPVP